jgi:hypothetical protein
VRAIDVRAVRQKSDSVAESPPAASAGYALEFNGQDSAVSLPTLRYDGSHSLTLEATIVPQTAEPSGTVVGCLANAGLGLQFPTVGGRLGSFEVFYAAKSRKVFTTTPIEFGRHMHVAAVRDRSNIRLFVDGVLQSMLECEGEYVPSNRSLMIGATRLIGGAQRLFRGTIDELRISKISRYSENFTPAARFESDADTLALYHFDEGSGDVLNDSSGNARRSVKP